MENDDRLGELQKALEAAMEKAFEDIGESASGLSFFATIEEETAEMTNAA